MKFIRIVVSIIIIVMAYTFALSWTAFGVYNLNELASTGRLGNFLLLQLSLGIMAGTVIIFTTIMLEAIEYIKNNYAKKSKNR